MKLIKVYNLEKLIQNEFPDCKAYDKDLCILIGNSGVVTFDKEGIGSTYDSVNDLIDIYMTDIPPDNIIYTMPQYKATEKIIEIVNAAEYRECELKEYFSRYNYNSRLKNNYTELLKAIDNIGLNSKKYIK